MEKIIQQREKKVFPVENETERDLIKIITELVRKNKVLFALALSVVISSNSIQGNLAFAKSDVVKRKQEIDSVLNERNENVAKLVIKYIENSLERYKNSSFKNILGNVIISKRYFETLREMFGSEQAKNIQILAMEKMKISDEEKEAVTSMFDDWELEMKVFDEMKKDDGFREQLSRKIKDEIIKVLKSGNYLSKLVEEYSGDVEMAKVVQRVRFLRLKRLSFNIKTKEEILKILRDRYYSIQRKDNFSENKYSKEISELIAHVESGETTGFTFPGDEELFEREINIIVDNISTYTTLSNIVWHEVEHYITYGEKGLSSYAMKSLGNIVQSYTSKYMGNVSELDARRVGILRQFASYGLTNLTKKEVYSFLILSQIGAFGLDGIDFVTGVQPNGEKLSNILRTLASNNVVGVDLSV